MGVAATPKAHNPDLAGQITYAMRSMGVAPIPRNYELFYEAFIGSNPALTRDIAALQGNCTQEEVDEISRKYFSHAQGDAVEHAHTRILEEMDKVLSALQEEQKSLQSYNRVLDDTLRKIDAKKSINADLIRTAVDLLAEATGKTISSGEKTVEDVVGRSQEMERVRKELDEYKRIANTDSLTRLSNRRAFDDKLAFLFDDKMMLPVKALVLCDIDHFKKVNDNFGHPVGDKILASVASLIRSNVRADTFVARTGGEEFALIFEGNTIAEVMTACERVRRNLEETPFRNSRTRINYGQMTMSFGICMASQATSPGELYHRADIALYCAKNAGRNRTVLYEEGMQKDFSKSWLIYKD